MPGQQEGRSALVTGGARGIGAAIARAYVDAGGSVVIGDIDDQRGSHVVAELGSRASYVHLDVTCEDDMAAAVDAAVQRLGALDCVFSNAGAVGFLGRIAETPLDAWRSTLELLLTSTFLSIKHAVRVMGPRGSGAIVCTASVASLRGGLGPHAYTAAKHGVKGLVESVAVEIAPLGLRINGVAPGGTVSSLAASLFSGDPDDLDNAYRQLGQASSSGVPTTAADVADASLFLASPSASRINGALLVVDGGDDVLGSAARSYFT